MGRRTKGMKHTHTQTHTQTNTDKAIPKSVQAKNVKHIRHFRWLGPNTWWEISQIYIEIHKSHQTNVCWIMKVFPSLEDRRWGKKKTPQKEDLTVLCSAIDVMFTSSWSIAWLPVTWWYIKNTHSRSHTHVPLKHKMSKFESLFLITTNPIVTPDHDLLLWKPMKYSRSGGRFNIQYDNASHCDV